LIDAVISRLQRHAARREQQGIPTVSVIVGCPSTVRQAWEHWAEARSLRLAINPETPIDPSSPEHETADPVRLWLARLVVTTRWPSAIAAHIARSHREPAPEIELRLRTKERGELLLYLASIRGDLSATITPELLADLLTRPASQVIRAWDDEPDPEAMHLAASLAELAGPSLPGLLVTLYRAAPGASARFFERMTRLAAEVPLAPLAVATDRATLEAFLSGRHDRAVALVREGLIDFEGTHSEGKPAEAPSTPDLLRRLGAEERLFAMLEGAAQQRAEAHRLGTECAHDRARSAAERFLFEVLSLMPETAGRFELNAKIQLHGETLREIDLLDRRGRLALEIDGYHHFQDPVAYRRDRHKDLLLQRSGLLVMRVLADDVVDRLEHMLDTIRDILAERCPAITPKG